MDNKQEILAPDVNTDAMNEVFDQMYITNVEKRLRDLNTPTDIDKKRWVWELIQNAKDTIALDPNRDEINVCIEIDGDTVKFKHDGAPFTAKARYGLLYKYSGGKENQESTGRFGTGFLTTHCLSKIVTIESNMYSNKECTELCGFEVTMYRDGLISSELIEGLRKMRASEKFFKQIFDWTTFTYHINSDSGRTAVKLGVQNFHENIAPTMLFCKELSSVELNDNGNITKIKRHPQVCLSENIFLAEYVIESPNSTCKRRFLFSHYEEPSKELSERYRKERKLRLDVAIEIDENCNIVNHIGKTAHYCVLPMVGIEDQLSEPVIVNSPDFEPDTERQSLILSGQIWNDEKNVITETGINQKIYEQVFPLYEKLVAFLSEHKYGGLYYLASGLDKAKSHKNLDKEWYVPNVIHKYRDILLKYDVVKSYDGSSYKKLLECIFVKEAIQKDETSVYSLLTALYPSKIVKDNHEWSQYAWKDGLDIWDTKDLCKDIEEKRNWGKIILDGISPQNWYNKFLEHVLTYDERYLKEYALLPNMNGDFLKKDAENFKQGEKVTPFVINLLSKLGKDVKPDLLHNEITALTLDAKYNSQSYSADINKLTKAFIDSVSSQNRLQNVLPLLSVLPTDTEKYKSEFISQRKDFFNIAKSLFALSEATPIEDNSLLEGAWSELDIWFVTYVLQSLNDFGDLSRLPEGLDAKWLNNSLKSLKVDVHSLNKYEVLPNQKGRFCAQNKLYEDEGVPDTLKADEFDSISLTYKDILLHKDIEASHFAINRKKDIASFATELKNRFDSANISYYNSSYTYPINGRYFKFPQPILNKIALYLLSLIPSDKETETGKSQYSLYTTAFNILGSEVVPLSNTINYSSNDLWQRANNPFVVGMISDKIKSAAKLETLNQLLGNKGELYVLEQLNAFYDFLQRSGVSYDASKIFPNQKGEFYSFKSLKKEDGKIDDTIKNIICLLVEESEDYRSVLMDSRCRLQPQNYLNSDTAYALIDEKVAELYKNPENWKDAKFIEASQSLIEDWGDKHKGIFEEKFPRIFGDKEKILMNVVWKKEKRELMLTLNSKLSEEQLKFVIDNSLEIKDLSDTNLQLSEENERLKRQNSELKELLAEIEQSGEVSIKRGDILKLERQKRIEAQLQAQQFLKSIKPDWEFPQGYGEVEDGNPCCDTRVRVTTPEGEKTFVLKSHIVETDPFKITILEWDYISEYHAKILVFTGTDIKEIDPEDLLRNQSSVSVSFSTKNLDKEERIREFAQAMHYFKELHFDFESFDLSAQAASIRGMYNKHDGFQAAATDDDI